MSEQNNSNKLLSETKSLILKYKEIAKLSGERYNIFKIIGLTSDEVRVHSKFIGNLLNPKGSHGQGYLFLKKFIELNAIENFNYKTATLHIEKDIGKVCGEYGGRIDILLEDINSKTIIIENKIYAKDSPNQLKRYHNYSKDNILYLTLYGSKPSIESSKDLVLNKDFKLISYQDNIIKWLEECKMLSVNLPLLREGISHYINLIKYLTGQSINKTMKKELVHNILNSKESLEAASQIANNLRYAKAEVQKKFWKKLKEKFKEFDKKITTDELSENAIDSYYNNNKRFIGLNIHLYQEAAYDVYYRIEVNHNVYFGFIIKQKDELVSNKLEFNNLKKELKLKINPDYKDDKGWLIWRRVKPHINFKEFNTEEVFLLNDETYLSEKVNQIYNESINDIINSEEIIKKYLREIKKMVFFESTK